ncbi:2-iminoacetate synthase ThiH [Verrucomicrobiaceae bacterium 5K15]|uniref:2-iminoacetate synthase ThiH n=1 Tax=Oceaniferula flava TaxID=2800421 RepID=A0AAE2VBD3_9BACT|nr:2-iminoacetate synthase ThiH [Oceaniferula flavus]MBK1854415.1 2-iminoacetate synthase ThiH [Oceaniferula flavus]MBM1135721.1 2-iminoacetate synthase ThiH [Oceaniferula flavus]
MSFSEQFQSLIDHPSPQLRKFTSLIEPADAATLESMALKSQQLTRHHFGKTMRLFAPLYVSNECVNNCSYCGFSRDNAILRTTLTIPQVVAEAQHLHSLGFRNILLVAGEHPKFVSEGYLQECIDAIKGFIPTIAIEVGPMKDHQYGELVSHGAEGLIVYQESYQRETYEKLHTAGPKKNFDWRLDCPERAYAGGFRRIGIGALFGLADWRKEAIALAAHLEYLYKHCWKASFNIAFPRMRPYAGNYQYTPDPNLFLNDRQFVQLACAFRICFPQVGIVLSTREPAKLRDSLVPLGITHMSAGSQTDPGGYTGAGTDDLHLTVKGKRVELGEDQPQNSCSRATEQFTIDDKRSPAEIADLLRSQGYDPVWKDWDAAILDHSGSPC